MQLRDTTPADFGRILELNEESVHFLSPLTPERLAWLYGMAAYRRVAVDDGCTVAGFLLAFREGAAYDSPNYQWFARHYASFLYIDRIVIAASHQGQGIGPRFYADLFAFARQAKIPRVTCEIDSDPPNEVSRRFHLRYGFQEVGSQRVAGGKKEVSLQAVSIEA
jgi:predicted GNAT superfamily acetyltransferase